MSSCDNTPNQGAKVPFDPGWNDPPTQSYNSQQVTPNRPRNFLNKRVAFPMSGSMFTGSPGNLPPVNLPPMPTASIPPSLPPATLPKANEAPSEEAIDRERSLGEVKEILLEFLNDSSELGPKANDIKKRIGMMEEMWISGKLNGAVQLKMLELACALRDDQPNAADEIHRALMVDHVSTVGTWMPGVKQLVHHCIARSELLSIDKES